MTSKSYFARIPSEGSRVAERTVSPLNWGPARAASKGPPLPVRCVACGAARCRDLRQWGGSNGRRLVILLHPKGGHDVFPAEHRAYGAHIGLETGRVDPSPKPQINRWAAVGICLRCLPTGPLSRLKQRSVQESVAPSGSITPITVKAPVSAQAFARMVASGHQDRLLRRDNAQRPRGLRVCASRWAHQNLPAWDSRRSGLQGRRQGLRRQAGGGGEGF